MKKIIDYIAEELSEAFEKAGYDRTYGKVTLSNRPDLCEYQCNGSEWQEQKLTKKHRS